MQCRFCKTELTHLFIDLVNSPASNSFLSAGQLNEPEVFYPLKVFVCSSCFLVKLDEYKNSDAIFTNEYFYFSSFSPSWLETCRNSTGERPNGFVLNGQSWVAKRASTADYF